MCVKSNKDTLSKIITLQFTWHFTNWRENKKKIVKCTLCQIANQKQLVYYISQWLCIDIRNKINYSYSSANSDIPDFTYCNQNSRVAVVASSTNIYCSTVTYMIFWSMIGLLCFIDSSPIRMMGEKECCSVKGQGGKFLTPLSSVYRPNGRERVGNGSVWEMDNWSPSHN